MNPPRTCWCQKPTGQLQAPSTQPPWARVSTENTRPHPKAPISSPCFLHPVAPRVTGWMLASPESDKNFGPIFSSICVSQISLSLSRSVATLKNFRVYPLRANHKYSFRSVLGMHYLLQKNLRAVVVVVLVFFVVLHWMLRVIIATFIHIWYQILAHLLLQKMKVFFWLILGLFPMGWIMGVQVTFKRGEHFRCW
jgi:hypothetical protein